MTTKERVEGSFKEKLIATSLQEERDKCAFDKEELTTFLLGGTEVRKIWDDWSTLMEKHPEIKNHHQFHEMNPDEKQQDLWRRVNFMHRNYPYLVTELDIGVAPYHSWARLWQGLLPGLGLHYSMFALCVKNLGN